MRWSTLLVLIAPACGQENAPAAAGAPQTAVETETLRVATREVPPFAVRDEQGEWTGITISLLEQVREDLAKERNGEVEVELIDMPLDDLLDAVEKGDVDLAAAALTVNFDREKRFDFSHPYFSSGLGIAVSRDNRADGPFAFVRTVLSPTFLRVVAGLVALMLGTAVALYFFERRVNREQFGGGMIRGVASGLWWSAVTLTTVGYGDKVPKSTLGRLIGLVWMFSGLFIIASFTAAVTSALTLTQLRTGISGPADLPRARVATVADSTSAAYLRARRVRFRSYADVGAALESLQKGRCDAVVYDAPLMRYEVHRRFEDTLQVIPSVFERQDYAFALPPGSPLRESVNQTLLRATSTPEWDEMLTETLGAPSSL